MMAKAWDDPHDTREGVCARLDARDGADDEASTKVRPTPSLAVPDAIDDPLPDAEIGIWEGNSSS